MLNQAGLPTQSIWVLRKARKNIWPAIFNRTRYSSSSKATCMQICAESLGVCSQILCEVCHSSPLLVCIYTSVLLTCFRAAPSDCALARWITRHSNIAQARTCKFAPLSFRCCFFSSFLTTEFKDKPIAESTSRVLEYGEAVLKAAMSGN